MARIDWVIVSDLAFFDRHARLCMVGITTRLIVPALPTTLRQLIVVAHVIDPFPEDGLDVGVAVSTPGGMEAIADGPGAIQIEVADEHVLVTLRDLLLTEEGPYRFAAHWGHHSMAVDVPVFVVPTERHAAAH